MSTYTLRAEVSLPYEAAVAATRAALADQGFGILTEIDLAATLKAKLDVDIPPELILGACRPPLAYAAIQADPAIAALLPCNVVVRSRGDGAGAVIEALDPERMFGITGDGEALAAVVGDARQRLAAALSTLGLGE